MRSSNQWLRFVAATVLAVSSLVSAACASMGAIREGFNLGSLGDRINLPAGVGSGLVLMESSHKAR